MEIARHWLNEEWYAEGLKNGGRSSGVSPLTFSALRFESALTWNLVSQSRPYDRWLRRLLQHILDFSSNKDKSFPQLIVDLPELPAEEISRLGEMCINPEQ